MSSIEISVNDLTALTSPFPIFKNEGLVYPSTVKTSFATWKEAVYLSKTYSIPFGLILQLSDKFRPSAILNAFCKMVICHNALHMQVFSKNALVFGNQPMTQFMKEIISLVKNLIVNTSNLYPSLVSSVTAFDFTRKVSLKPFQFIFRLMEILRSVNSFTIDRLFKS